MLFRAFIVLYVFFLAAIRADFKFPAASTAFFTSVNPLMICETFTFTLFFHILTPKELRDCGQGEEKLSGGEIFRIASRKTLLPNQIAS